MTELQQAIDWLSAQPCADCGNALGDTWKERYNASTDRLVKVHQSCPDNEAYFADRARRGLGNYYGR